MSPSTFQLPESVSGFHDYFRMSGETDEVLAALGYAHTVAPLTLPAGDATGQWVDDLRARIDDVLPLISLGNETARREALVAPILLELTRRLQARLRFEYPISVSPLLRGNLDYLMTATGTLLVVEAKFADVTHGFTQLAAQLVALDAITNAETPVLYGAVTVGDVWRFGVLDRARKRVSQDTNQFRVPTDLAELLAALVGIVQGVAAA